MGGAYPSVRILGDELDGLNRARSSNGRKRRLIVIKLQAGQFMPQPEQVPDLDLSVDGSGNQEAVVLAAEPQRCERLQPGRPECGRAPACFRPVDPLQKADLTGFDRSGDEPST